MSYLQNVPSLKCQSFLGDNLSDYLLRKDLLTTIYRAVLLILKEKINLLLFKVLITNSR